MTELMLDADLTIGAGGFTSWVKCCLGLPTIVFDKTLSCLNPSF
jgi:spore coat polysaccharide biosynthesis predicted glycosyltransferase SpsG